VENAVEEAIEKGRQVFVVGATDTTQRRLEKLGLYKTLPLERTNLSRHEALQQAVASLA
jgi:SulP family sulfate permease